MAFVVLLLHDVPTDRLTPCITGSDYPVGIRSCGGDGRKTRAGMVTDGE